MTSPGGSNLEIAGGVGVEVYPDTTGFSDKLGRAILPDAKKLGTELAKTISAGIAESISSAVVDGVRRSSAAATAQATRAGEGIGAEMGRAIKARLDVAMRDLPNARIGVDLDNADVAAVRAELAKLRDKTVTVNADVTAAYVDIATLREEINRLPRRVSIKVDADVLGGLAEIRALRTELEALRNRPGPSPVPTPRPGPSGGGDDGASGVRQIGQAAESSNRSVGALISTIILLGPAVIPVAAAAAAAIAGIGVAAAGVGAALGVGVLGFSGIGSAVQALGTQQADAAKNTADYQAKQEAAEQATRGVASAQQALDNAYYNSGQSARLAAQQVAGAEQSVQNAQIQSQRAQQALTQARIDAKRALEDYQSQLQHLGLDEKQAQIDLDRAAANLKAAQQGLPAQQANGPSNQVSGGVRPDFVAPTIVNPRAVEEAQLAYDQAALKLKDLQTQQQRTSEDYAKANAKGIEGSTQVVAALDQVRAANQALQGAEQSLANARESQANQARTNAQSIANAQQALADAQRAQAKAAQDAMTAANASATALATAMKGLSPAGQEFARFLFSLKPQLDALKKTAQEGFLPGLQHGIEALLPAMPGFRDAVGRVAVVLGDLAQKAGEALASPYWQHFFQFLTDIAVPALQLMGPIIGNVAKGVAGLLQAFAPIGQDFGVGLLNFAQHFAEWANNTGPDSGLGKLIAYIEDEGPVVADVLGKLWTLAMHIVEALAPLGSVIVRAIGLLADALNKIPLPILASLLTTGWAIFTMFQAWKGIQAIIKFAFATDAIVFFEQVLVNFRSGAALAAAEDGAGAIARAFAGTRAAIGGASSDLTGFAKFLTGPWGIALAAATVAATLFFTGMQEHKQAVDELVSSLGKLSDAYQQTGSLQSQQSVDAILNNKTLSDLAENTDQYGVSIKDLLAAQTDQAKRQEILNTLTKKQHELAAQASADPIGSYFDGTDDQIDNVKKAIDATKKWADETTKREKLTVQLTGQTQAQADAEKRVAEQEQQRAQQLQQANPTYTAMVNLQMALNDAQASGATKADALRQADKALFDEQRNGIIAEEDATHAKAQSDKAWTDFIKTVQGATKAHKEDANSLDAATDAGYANRKEIENRLDVIKQQFFADVQSGVQLDVATKKFNDNRDAVKQAADQTFHDKDAVGQLVTAFGTLPTDPTVKVSVQGVADVMTQMETVQIAQFGLAHGYTPTEAVQKWNEQKAAAEAERQDHLDKLRRGRGGLGYRNDGTPYATGGPIVGPGGPTDDLVPATGPGGARYRLSDGEHIVTAAEVQAAGGHAAIMAWRKAMLAGAPVVPAIGRASGGPVIGSIWPVNVDLSKTIFPGIDFNPSGLSVSEIMSKLPGSGADVPIVGGPYTGGTGVGQWAGVVAQVLQALGQPSYMAGAVLRRIAFESGGNPTIVNRSDSNWYAGHPSVGLAQVINSTYRRWVGQYDKGPYEYGVSVDPFANVYAGMRYALNRYHSIAAIDPITRPYGYDSGGYLPPGFTTVFNGTGKPEPVFTSEQWDLLANRRPAAAGDTHYTNNVYPQRADFKIGDLVALQHRQEALSRVGRPR